MAQSPKQYRLYDFDPSKNQVVVRFVDKEVEMLIDLPVVDGKYITGEPLDNYILSFYPGVVAKPSVPKATNPQDIECLVSSRPTIRGATRKMREHLLQERQVALASCDWTQLPDAQKSMDEQEKQRWLEFRQALRDITKQPGWPEKVDWPKRPYLLGVTIFDE
jgi:hypothetical protein